MSEPDTPAPTPPARSIRGRLERGVVRTVVWVAASALLLVGAVVLMVLGVGSLIPGAVLALAVVGLIAFRKRLRLTFAVGVALCLAIVVWRASISPRNDRNWSADVSLLPTVTMDAGTDLITIEGVRNFRWRDDGSHEPNWETRTYHLSNLQGVDLILEPFTYSSLMAHTMLSFDFGADGRVILSIEARKEVGEAYNPITGGLNQFELIYLFIDERDALGARAGKGHELYAFPTRFHALKHRAFFLSLCAAANNLHTKPQFYHIIRHNCTTVWIEHSDHLSPNPIGLSLDAVLNGRIGRLLHARGIINTDLPYEQAKARHRIDERVTPFIDSPEFSQRIREHPAATP